MSSNKTADQLLEEAKVAIQKLADENVNLLKLLDDALELIEKQSESMHKAVIQLARATGQLPREERH